MEPILTSNTYGREEDYRGWSLRRRLELLAFDARLARGPWALLEALWEAIDGLQVTVFCHWEGHWRWRRR